MSLYQFTLRDVPLRIAAADLMKFPSPRGARVLSLFPSPPPSPYPLFVSSGRRGEKKRERWRLAFVSPFCCCRAATLIDARAIRRPARHVTGMKFAAAHDDLLGIISRQFPALSRFDIARVNAERRSPKLAMLRSRFPA